MSLGLIFEVYGTMINDLKRVFGLAMRPMMFISGLFFTIEMVPQSYQALLYWNPVLHGVDLVRDAVMYGYTSPASLYYMWAVILSLLFVGLSAYHRYQYRLI